ncbi:AraC family transcriptional regulator [Paenibacillus sp. DXFW5]|uniref:AraC family transcriptional regulator n=1 Tax=Paenibacillus rhizolycopersici TaxID=2780073 RepID=A0ABS2GZ55_9BACL|nr:AraC family transcriptional regulator [Paenibacillus rhizolycopersici]MBM6994130.1 AraC family transcriptional regulator [Paenibacillus rhizolycopersici]
MGVKVDFEVHPFKAVRFIGKEVVVGKKNPVPELWNHILNDGTNDLLQSLPERVSPKGDTIGWMGEYNPQTQEFVYIAGIFAEPNAAVPNGFSYRDIPDCLMGIGWIQGTTSHLEKGAHGKTEKIMRANGYEPDYSVVGISMEYYSFEKYANIQEDGMNLFTFGYYLPCKEMA